MGRLIFPDASEAFGYQRIHNDAPQSDGMAHYGPGEIGQALGVVEKLTDVAKFGAQAYLQNRKSPRDGQTPMDQPLTRRPIIAGGNPVVRHGDVQDVPEVQPQQAQPTPAQPAVNPEEPPEIARYRSYVQRMNESMTRGDTMDPDMLEQKAWMERRIGRWATSAGQQSDTQAQDDQVMADRQTAVNDELGTLREIQQRTIGLVNSGKRLSPNAARQFRQVESRIAQLEGIGHQDPLGRSAQPAAAAPAAAAPGAAGPGGPAGVQVTAPTSAAGVINGAITADVQEGTPPPMGSDVPNRQPPGAAAAPQDRWAVNVDPNRRHSIAELQALIASAKRTNNPEDVAAVQQAILAAPLDDAQPQSWLDIFSEAAGRGSQHREATRQALLSQLVPSAKDVDPLLDYKRANYDSLVESRRERNELVREQEQRAATQNKYEAQKIWAQIEERIAHTAGLNMDRALKGVKYGTALYQQRIAAVNADMQRQLNIAKINFQNSLGSAAVESAHARTAHELPGDVHASQANTSGGMQVRAVADIIKDLRKVAEKAEQAAAASGRKQSDTAGKMSDDTLGGLPNARARTLDDTKTAQKGSEALRAAAGQMGTLLEELAANPQATPEIMKQAEPYTKLHGRLKGTAGGK